MSDFMENMTIITSAASILSASQLLHFTYGSPLFERFGSPVFGYVSAAVGSLVVPATRGPIHQDSISYLLAATLCACLVWFIGYYCFIFFSISKDGRLGSTLKLVLKLSCLFYLLVESLLVVVITQLTGITIACTLNPSGMGSSKIQCRTTPRILDWALTVLLGIPFLCYIMFLKLLFASPNPLSRSAQAGFNSSRHKILFCLRIVLPLLELLLDSSPVSLFFKSVVALIGHTLVLRVAWKSPQSPHTGTSLLHTCIDVLQVTSTVFCFGLWISSLVSPNDGWQSKSLLYLLLGSFASIAIGFWIEIKKSELFRAELIFLSPSENQVEEYFFTLILRVDNFGTSEQKSLATWLALKGISDHLQQALQTKPREQAAIKTECFEVVLHLIDWALGENPQRKYQRLRIAQASIHCERRKNPWKSYHCLEALASQTELLTPDLTLS